MGAMELNARIYLAGHDGMVGSALARRLEAEGYTNVVTATLRELDLRDEVAVKAWFRDQRPDYVFLAAARVGGIQANRTHPAEFLYDNLAIQNNVIHHSWKSGVKKLVFLGSSCVYPRECPQPMREEYLMTGPLEPTNEGYALAKIAGLKMAAYYEQQYGFKSICPMPCNLYGTNDSFDPQHSHVLAALVRRFVDAAEEGVPAITLWGTGRARREFMHVDDVARAVLFLLEHWDTSDIINVGPGDDVSIAELAQRIAAQAGFAGELRWDPSMPDGMPRKCLDVTRLNRLGFRPEISLDEGISRTIAEYRRRKAVAQGGKI